MEAFESKGLKVNFEKTWAMISGCITKDDLSESMVDQCVVCSMTVKAKFCVYSVVSGSMVDVYVDVMESVTHKLSRNFTCRKCDGNIGEAVE